MSEMVKVKGKVNHSIETIEDINYFDLVFEDGEYEIETFGDRFNGLEFLDNVLSLGFIDFDGCIDTVLLDGYNAPNIRLVAGGLGDCDYYDYILLLDEEAWRDMCKDYEVIVYWCNN